MMISRRLEYLSTTNQWRVEIFFPGDNKPAYTIKFRDQHEAKDFYSAPEAKIIAYIRGESKDYLEPVGAEPIATSGFEC